MIFWFWIFIIFSSLIGCCAKAIYNDKHRVVEEKKVSSFPLKFIAPEIKPTPEERFAAVKARIAYKKPPLESNEKEWVEEGERWADDIARGMFVEHHKNSTKKFESIWDRIETLNKNVGINRDNSYMDDKGYLRWNSNNKLCHRDVAFKYLYKGKGFVEPFRNYIVHHVDENKLNDDPSNLKIMKEEKHEEIHGRVVNEDGTKWIRLCRRSKVGRETKKAIRVAMVWLPKSQCVVRDDYVYVTPWAKAEFDRAKGNVDSKTDNLEWYDRPYTFRSKSVKSSTTTSAVSNGVCKLGRTTCTGCEFYNEFDKVCGK